MKKLRILELVFILSLVGVIVFQQYQISGMSSQNKELALSNQQKDTNYAELMNRYNQLNASYQHLLSTMQSYFFFQDPDFLISGMPNQCWKDEFWNYETGSYINITNGIANLCYRQPDGKRWGNANFLQGKEPHKNNEYRSLLVGLTEKLLQKTQLEQHFIKIIQLNLTHTLSNLGSK